MENSWNLLGNQWPRNLVGLINSILPMARAITLHHTKIQEFLNDNESNDESIIRKHHHWLLQTTDVLTTNYPDLTHAKDGECVFVRACVCVFSQHLAVFNTK